MEDIINTKRPKLITRVNLTVPIYIISVCVLYACYFILYFGIYAIDAGYIRYLSIFIHVLVCSFLLIRFNPFYVVHDYQQSDGIIIFGSAFLLLTNVIATEIGLGTFVEYSSTRTFDYHQSMIRDFLFPSPKSKNKSNLDTPILQYSLPTENQRNQQNQQKQIMTEMYNQPSSNSI